jgi:drug/metabolite transporter (DMT)-like permease
MKQQQKAIIFALSAVLLWSTMATAFNIALQYVDYMLLLLLASGVATIVMFLIILMEGKINIAFSISKKELFQAAIRGLLNPFLYYLILFKAYSILPAQEAMTLNYIWPITLVLLSVPLLKQKLSIVGLLAILLSFAGVVIIATKGDPMEMSFSNLEGDLLAVSTSVVWSLFWIINIKSKMDESIKLFYSFLFGFIFTIPVVAIFSNFAIPTKVGLIASIYVGVAEMGITFFFWLMALKLAKRTDQVSLFIYLTPFLSLLFISSILKEQIHESTLIGLAFILGGIFLNKWWENRRGSLSH